MPYEADKVRISGQRSVLTLPRIYSRRCGSKVAVHASAPSGVPVRRCTRLMKVRSSASESPPSPRHRGHQTMFDLIAQYFDHSFSARPEIFCMCPRNPWIRIYCCFGEGVSHLRVLKREEHILQLWSHDLFHLLLMLWPPLWFHAWLPPLQRNLLKTSPRRSGHTGGISSASI